jgi:hypothetical protein
MDQQCFCFEIRKQHTVAQFRANMQNKYVWVAFPILSIKFRGSTCRIDCLSAAADRRSKHKHWTAGGHYQPEGEAHQGQ